MVVPWSEISARKWARMGKPIAAHEFCKRLICLQSLRRLVQAILSGADYGECLMAEGEIAQNAAIGVPNGAGCADG